MWIYTYDVNGNRAKRNEKCSGFLPMALRESIKSSGKSTFQVRGKVKGGQVRLGISAQKGIADNAWTRSQFLYLDGNISN